MLADDGFHELRQRRLRYIAASRENEFEEGLRTLLADLYPDNAHFIYELLQNAEDANASMVEFTLTESALMVTHNGARRFTLADVDSITSIGKSTKKDDETLIGKFGVGFKAVFAYTNRPEVASGEYSFAIEDLFVPVQTADASQQGKTVFKFPFDRPAKPAETAVVEVERGLRELGEKTLLFLNHIRSLSYRLPDGRIGMVERRDIDERTVAITVTDGDDLAESTWLKLVGPSTVEHTGPSPLTVSAAFRLIRPDTAPRGGARSTGARIVPEDAADVSIYFPAAKETSGLKFHIHAPFASTVARDSVRDDPSNDQLVRDIGGLIASHLPALRDSGLLTESLLAALPNCDDPLERPYTFIRDAVMEAFNESAITPVHGGRGFGQAASLVSSPSEFRNWLVPADLPELFNFAGVEADGSPRWIRDFDGRAGKFISGLDTIVFGWAELADVLKGAVGAEAVLTEDEDAYDPDDWARWRAWFRWLEAKDDEAVLRLYQLVGHGIAEQEITVRSPRMPWYGVDLPSVPVIRLRRRGRVEHVIGRETYLPSSRADTTQSRVPVELSYFSDDEDSKRTSKLQAFYTGAGVKRWNATAKVQVRLNKYIPLAPAPDDADLSRNLNDVRAFVEFAKSNPQEARRILGSVRFLLSPDDSGGSFSWVRPTEIYLDEPFLDTGLRALFERSDLEQDRRHPAAGIYLNVDGFTEFLQHLGALSAVEVSQANIWKNGQSKAEWYYANRENNNTVRHDWVIHDFDAMVATENPRLLLGIWDTVVGASSSRAVAVYKANMSANEYKFDSQLLQQLRSAAWILDRDGHLRLPREVTFEELPDDWQYPSNQSSLAYKIGIGAEAELRRTREALKPSHAKALGVELEEIEEYKRWKAAGGTLENLREQTEVLQRAHEFPGADSEDPERRSAVATQDAATAPDRRTEPRMRSVEVDRPQAVSESRTFLRQQYTNNAGDMFCQACHKVLPFKVKGEWYFEAVQFVTGLTKAHTANMLALCPLCAALYKYTRLTANDALTGSLLEHAVGVSQASVDIPVLLNNKRVELRFTGTHAIDLQAALRGTVPLNVFPSPNAETCGSGGGTVMTAALDAVCTSHRSQNPAVSVTATVISARCLSPSASEPREDLSHDRPLVRSAGMAHGRLERPRMQGSRFEHLLCRRPFLPWRPD